MPWTTGIVCAGVSAIMLLIKGPGENCKAACEGKDNQHNQDCHKYGIYKTR